MDPKTVVAVLVFGSFCGLESLFRSNPVSDESGIGRSKPCSNEHLRIFFCELASYLQMYSTLKTKHRIAPGEVHDGLPPPITDITRLPAAAFSLYQAGIRK